MADTCWKRPDITHQQSWKNDLDLMRSDIPKDIGTKHSYSLGHQGELGKLLKTVEIQHVATEWCFYRDICTQSQVLKHSLSQSGLQYVLQYLQYYREI